MILDFRMVSLSYLLQLIEGSESYQKSSNFLPELSGKCTHLLFTALQCLKFNRYFPKIKETVLKLLKCHILSFKTKIKIVSSVLINFKWGGSP